MNATETKPVTAQQLYDELMAGSAKINREIAERLTGEDLPSPTAEDRQIALAHAVHVALHRYEGTPVCVSPHDPCGARTRAVNVLTDYITAIADQVPRVEVGDRMRISVELIRIIATDGPDGFPTAIVRVHQIVTENDGTKTLWLTKDRS